MAEKLPRWALYAFIVGLPLHRNGEEGAAVGRVRAFVGILRPLLPEEVTVHEVDEHRTTVSAMEKLHAAGRNAKNSKGIIDMAAAVEILQSWLDQRAGETAPMGEPF